MARPKTDDTSQYIDNWEHDPTLKLKKVMPYGWDGANAIAVKVNTDGELMVSSLVPEKYDYVAQVQAATTDTWTFKTGGSGGTTVATVTITYVDATKAVILNVART